jgi:hypothetical protein
MSPRNPGPDDPDAIFPDVDGGLARSNEVSLEWERTHPTTLESTLEWIESNRALFGDPVANREPWRGDDYRL